MRRFQARNAGHLRLSGKKLLPFIFLLFFLFVVFVLVGVKIVVFVILFVVLVAVDFRASAPKDSFRRH